MSECGCWYSCVAPDCLAILKIVHELTERLIRGTLQTAARQQQLLQSPDILTQLVTVARRIGPRVDDVVNALYPPLDPRLLEARYGTVSETVVTRNASDYLLSITLLTILLTFIMHHAGCLDSSVVSVLDFIFC